MNFRLGVYTTGVPIPREQFEQFYQKIDALEQEKNYLWPYWGILYAEHLINAKDDIDKEMAKRLKMVYKIHKKQIQKESSSSVLHKTADWAFLMMYIWPQNRLDYLMDARMFLMRTLSKDRDNLEGRVSLGKWWAYRVMSSKHREVNHSIAQVKAYLSDKNLRRLLDSEQGPWMQIDIFNAYRVRAVMNLRSLDTAAYGVDMDLAKNALPHYHPPLLETAVSINIVKRSRRNK
ncbi:MAG: hypothetical protein ACRCVN_02935 [Spirochaetia bacterium]